MRKGPCPYCGSHKLGGAAYADFCDAWWRFYCDRQAETDHSVRGQTHRVLTQIRLNSGLRKKVYA